MQAHNFTMRVGDKTMLHLESLRVKMGAKEKTHAVRAALAVMMVVFDEDTDPNTLLQVEQLRDLARNLVSTAPEVPPADGTNTPPSHQSGTPDS